MALQESIKRTETNQQIATAVSYTLITQLSDQPLTKIKVIHYELPRNDSSILPSHPHFSLPTPCPAPSWTRGPKAQGRIHSKHKIFLFAY